MPRVAAQDLEAHHRALEPELTSAAARVLRSGRYILGPEVEAFEREAAAALGAAHAVGMSSGTDALLAILMALGVGPGDEVVTSPFSFFATAGVIVRLGARPVFADIDPATFNLDAGAAAARLGDRTRAVIPVHLFGRAAATAELEARCRARGVAVVEDAAQAIGATRRDGDSVRRVGALGDAAALSFFPAKNLGGFGDAGMVLTGDAQLADRLRLVRAHGSRPKYHHLIVGGNFRLDELQAALLRVKLPHLPRWTDGRRRVAARYHERLRGTPLALPPPDEGCVWNQFVVRVPDGRRDALATSLREAGIETAVYYPEPLHLQPCFEALGHRPGDFPVAERACQETLALPMYPELADSQIDAVADAIAAFFARGVHS